MTTKHRIVEIVTVVFGIALIVFLVRSCPESIQADSETLDEQGVVFTPCSFIETEPNEIKFSANKALIVELGNGYMKFFKDDCGCEELLLKVEKKVVCDKCGWVYGGGENISNR